MSDPFSVLGISSSASEEEIKSAYRKLAKKYHPDLNPGDKSAEEKMRQINDAYTKALQYRKTGSFDSPGSGDNPYGRSTSGYYSGNPFGGYYNGSSSGQSYNRASNDDQWGESRQYRSGNPFESYGFGFDPFSAFGFGQQQTGFRQRSYAHPDLQSAAEYILAKRFTDAIQLLNRVSVHNADWHALYARADYALGNRVSALDHARSAVRMSPQDQEYQQLLSQIESRRQEYHQTQSGRSDFQSVICANPFLTCCAANILLNCCLGGCGRYGMFC